MQAYLHVQNTITTDLPTEGSSAFLDDGVEIGLQSHERTQQANDLPEPPRSTEKADISRSRISVITHTPLPTSSLPRYDLADPACLAWLQPKQQRKCTLCLEPMKDPSSTTCGHTFCFTCILDWLGEKQECPLCRQRVLSQHGRFSLSGEFPYEQPEFVLHHRIKLQVNVLVAWTKANQVCYSLASERLIRIKWTGVPDVTFVRS